MPATTTATAGYIDVPVQLELGSESQPRVALPIAYEVTQAILTQPSTFSLKFGWGNEVRKLLPYVQPFTPFRLRINGLVQQTGFIDGWHGNDSAGGTELTVIGRDALAQLHDAYVDTETSYQDSSFYDLVEAALRRVYGANAPTLISNNDANRKAISGVDTIHTGPPPDAQADASTQGRARQLRARLGMRWFEFLKVQLDRAGLFLWAAGDGSLVLAAPNAKQTPRYKILRQRGLPRNAVSLVHAEVKNTTEGRFSEAKVYARGGGKSFGRTKSEGHFVDDEMVAYGVNRPLVFRDTSATTPAQAQFLARRKIAESRRNGFSLTYTVAGHVTPSLTTKGLATWAADTIVQVQDDEYGLNENFYIERVIFRRNPATTTELHLIRPDTLVFGEGEFI